MARRKCRRSDSSPTDHIHPIIEADLIREKINADRDALVDITVAESRRHVGMGIILSMLVAFGMGTYTFYSWQETSMYYNYRSNPYYLGLRGLNEVGKIFRRR